MRVVARQVFPLELLQPGAGGKPQGLQTIAAHIDPGSRLKGASLPRHDLKTTQLLPMPFPHIEAGGPLLHAIPQNAVDHPRYLPGDSRRAVYAAGIQGAYTRAQEPEKTPLIIQADTSPIRTAGTGPL